MTRTALYLIAAVLLIVAPFFVYPVFLMKILCFALFFSFVGTVLGGIWADQSWGRFWGWDPKENGALLIVLHYEIHHDHIDPAGTA